MDLGHQILLMTVHPWDSTDFDERVDVVRVGGHPPLSYFVAARAVRSQLKAFAPDVVHAHYASGYGTLARLVKFHPTVLSVWGSDVFAFPEASRWNRHLLLRNLLFPDQVCATSDVMGRRVEQLTSGEVSPVIIPFGVDTHRFSPSVGARRTRPHVVGTIKALSDPYRIDDLIRAFAIVKERIHDAELAIAGDGPKRTALESLASELGLADSVRFLGQIPHSEVVRRLQGLDVFCALSSEESFGVAVLEASACSIPVVVSSAGGLPEVVRDGETGFIVDVGDYRSAAERITRLLESSALRSELGDNGRLFVQQTYEWANCVSRLDDVLLTTMRAYEQNVHADRKPQQTMTEPFDPTRYWQGRLSAHAGLDGVGYLGLGSKYNEVLYHLRQEVFDRTVSDLRLPPNSSVADIGTGTGFYVERWLAAGVDQVTGCDLTPIAVERLQEKFPGQRFSVEDIGEPSVPLGGQRFAAVSAMDILFHIVDEERWAQAIRNLSDLVEPGGYLIISDNLPRLLRAPQRGEHQRHRCLDRYVEQLVRVGLDVVSIRPMFVLMNGPVGVGPVRSTAWRIFARLLSLNTGFAGLVGKAMLPVERQLVKRNKRSASTEILVCRKSA